MGRGRLVIRAARVAGVEIPNQKRLETALTCAHARCAEHSLRARSPALTPLAARPLLVRHGRYIYGIGPTTAKAILVETVRAQRPAQRAQLAPVAPH